MRTTLKQLRVDQTRSASSKFGPVRSPLVTLDQCPAT